MGKILRIILYASLAPLFMLPALVTVDVVARNLFNVCVVDAVEISKMLLSMLISLAMPYTAYTRGNVMVSFFVDRLSTNTRAALDSIASLIGAVVFYIMFWQATARAIYSIKTGEFIGAMYIPLYPSRFIFAFGCLLTALALTDHFINFFQRGKCNQTG